MKQATEQLKEFKAWIIAHQNRFPYLHNEIDKFYQNCLNEIQRGQSIPQAIQEAKEKATLYIFR